MRSWDLDVQREDCGGEFGGTDTPDYRSLNPNGLIPTLVDGPIAVWESNTILRYIANKFDGGRFYPSDPAARAMCEKWMDWQLSVLNPPFSVLFRSLVRTAPENRDLKQTETARANVEKHLTLLDQALGGRSFLTGETLSLADISLGIFAYRWFELPVDRTADLASLQGWYGRLSDRDPFKKIVMVGLS